MIRLVSKILRALMVFWRKVFSVFQKAFYRLAYYPNISFGSDVLLLGKVRLSASDGGNIRIESGTTICSGAELVAKGGRIQIGQNAHIGQGTIVVAVNAVEIEKDALIAERVSIRDQNHGMTPGTPFREQLSSSSPVLIGKNVWLGASTFISAGVEIGDNAVVGANAAVTKNLESGSVYAGVPAKKIRDL